MAAPRASQASSRRCSITLSLNASNVLNHVNRGTPSGDLSSPFVGQYRSLGGGLGPMGGNGGGTYNRKVDVQLRFSL